MNSKIKKFIEGCTETTEIVNPETGITHHREFFDKEKFAELIVRECIERVREQYIPIRDQTVEEKLHPLYPLNQQLRLRTEREMGIVECGVNSVIALEELIRERTDKWYKENILGVE